MIMSGQLQTGALLPSMRALAKSIHVSYILHDGVIEYITAVGAILPAFAVGSVLLMAGLIYPLAFTKFGRNSETGLAVVSIAFSSAIMGGISGGASGFGLSEGVIALIMIGVAGVIFVISCIITRKLYSKMDF